MSNGSKFLLVLGVVVFMFAGLFGFGYVSYSNAEIRLVKQIEAKQKSNENHFDTMWKVISQQAMITEQYKDSFKDIYGDIMANRYSGEGGSLMKWVQESNPQFDSSLYSKLMTSVESLRLQFQRDQDQLIDLNNEHNMLIATLPGSLFVGNRPEIEITVVTSARTDETFKTGQDNDVDLFKQGK